MIAITPSEGSDVGVGIFAETRARSIGLSAGMLSHWFILGDVAALTFAFLSASLINNLASHFLRGVVPPEPDVADLMTRIGQMAVLSTALLSWLALKRRYSQRLPLLDEFTQLRYRCLI